MRKRRLSRSEMTWRIRKAEGMAEDLRQDYWQLAGDFARVVRRAKLLEKHLRETEARALKYATELDDKRAEVERLREAWGHGSYK